MKKTERNKELILRLSSDEYDSLYWLSQKLGLSISQTLRGLIPNYRQPSGRIIKPKAVKSPLNTDSVGLVGQVKIERLKTLLNELKDTGHAISLHRELHFELVERGMPCLSLQAYKRLSRWISPRRNTSRERDVKRIAERISKCLFGGEVISRVE